MVVMLKINNILFFSQGRLNITATDWLTGLTVQAPGGVCRTPVTCEPQLFFKCGDAPPFHIFVHVYK